MRALPSWLAINRRADRAPADKAAAMAISRSRSLLAALLLVLSGSTAALVWSAAGHRAPSPAPVLAASAAEEDDPSNPITAVPSPSAEPASTPAQPRSTRRRRSCRRRWPASGWRANR